LYRAVDKESQAVDFLLTRHRDIQTALRWAVRPMLSFKSFASACCTLSGIELMHMIKENPDARWQ
jgi:transposase-like protein